MKKFTIFLLVIVIIGLQVGIGSGIAKSNGQGVDPNVYLYLPLVMKNYPLITVFGIDGSSNFDQIGQAGVTWDRLNTALLWKEVQPDDPNTSNWNNSNAQQVESQILAARSQGLNVLLIVRGTPTWAMKSGYAYKACGPIDRNYFDAFATFMQKVVEKYSYAPYNVSYFAVWNEPDAGYQAAQSNDPNGCWGDTNLSYSGGQYYGDMLNVVYPKMKSANPSVKVVLGSLLLYCDPRWVKYGACPDPTTQTTSTFFEGVIKTAKNAVDVVAYNGQVSYASGQNPVWNEKNNWRWAASGGLMDGKINYLQSILAKYGVSKPIMLTEGGLVDGDSTSAFEEAKSDYMVYMNANGWSKGLLSTIWYTMKGWKGSELVDSSNQPKPAYNALKTMTTILKESQFTSREDLYGYSKFVFTLGSQEIWLLIPTGKDAGTSYSISRPSNFIKLVNIYGVDQPDPGNPNSFSRPVYVFRNK